MHLRPEHVCEYGALAHEYRTDVPDRRMYGTYDALETHAHGNNVAAWWVWEPDQYSTSNSWVWYVQYVWYCKQMCTVLKVF